MRQFLAQGPFECLHVFDLEKDESLKQFLEPEQDIALNLIQFKCGRPRCGTGGSLYQLRRKFFRHKTLQGRLVTIVSRFGTFGAIKFSQCPSLSVVILRSVSFQNHSAFERDQNGGEREASRQPRWPQAALLTAPSALQSNG